MPARASLLTGRHPLTIGRQYGVLSSVANNSLSAEEITLAEILKSDDYMNYIVGKWHLGAATPCDLPTARGFDFFWGFTAAQEDFWSKQLPQKDRDNFRDFTYSDKYCYHGYDEDFDQYSTFFYRDKAVQIINSHNFTDSPMFLYLPFQAVHIPWTGDLYPNGIPENYLNKKTYNYIYDTFDDFDRVQYMLALSIVDSAVSSIYSTLEAKEVLNDTYIIFASDNGGCIKCGGRNGLLRGSKG
jgi:arylsulfatase B